MDTKIKNNKTLKHNIKNERMNTMATITNYNTLTLINDNERMKNMTYNVMTLNNKKSGSLIERISDWLQERISAIREMNAAEITGLCEAQEMGIGIGAYLKRLAKDNSVNRNAYVYEMAMDYYRAIEDGSSIPMQMQLLQNLSMAA
ncbi:MAG: hypothetical protein FWG88_06910 [Oscillospiraceae bacterium]|nr:hypothetical protein [Oscillospiraceae bacterium]